MTFYSIYLTSECAVGAAHSLQESTEKRRYRVTEKFKLGEIVQLKSGGPAMTVSEEPVSGSYWCEWFKGASKERALFKVHTLTKYEVPKKND